MFPNQGGVQPLLSAEGVPSLPEQGRESVQGLLFGIQEPRQILRRWLVDTFMYVVHVHHTTYIRTCTGIMYTLLIHTTYIHIYTTYMHTLM